MTKDTLTLGSFDLLALAETVEVTVFPSSGRYEHSYNWQSVPDPTVRQEHRDLALRPFGFTQTVVIPNCRCSMISIDDLIKSKSNPNIARLIRKALRTYPKRMSRAKRKEARARERRRVERHNQWWSKR